ncbi:MAG: hypothetical protein WCH99_12330 [Verrucomicrobiota bacterium]
MILTREKNNQPMVQASLLPTGRNWLEWQACKFSDLAKLIAEADADGFDAVRMVADWKRGKYEVQCQRKPQPTTERIDDETGV